MKLLLLDLAPQMEQLAAELEASGDFETIACGDVDSALEELRTSELDAVVLAASFAKDSGGAGEILRHTRAGGPPVLMVLDEPAELATLESPEAIEDFLIKPIDAAVLRARLLFMLRRHSPPQSTLARLPDVIFRIARDGVFAECHAASAEQSHLDSGSIKGMHLTALMPDKVARTSMAMIRRVLDSNVPGYLEYELPVSDGVRSYEAHILPCGTESALFIAHDVTERKRADARMRTATAVKHAFTSRVISAQEAERQHLSRELHERIGQMLLVHRMDAEWLTKKIEPGPLRDAAEELCTSLDRTLETVRNLAMDLRPPSIDDLGIGSALESLVANIAKRAGIHCEYEIDPQVASVPADVSVAIYRIAQEALTNAVHHAQCKNIVVYLTHDEGNLELQVVDDGIGFDPSKEEVSSWLGLVGMRERANLVGGQVTIESGTNEGTCVKVVVPNVVVRSHK